MRRNQRKNSNAQSAMEYLMTYGWAILIIAVVLAVLYQLGVFTSSSFASQGCFAEPGYTCQKPLMNSTGNVSITLGQISAQAITVTELGCSNSQTQPTMVSLTTPIVLPSSALNTTTFQCPISSNSISAPFTGYLWIGYTTPSQQTPVLAEIATLTTSVSTLGLVGPPPPPITYTSNSAVTGYSTTATITLGSSDKAFFCGANNGYTPLTPSWTVDASATYVSIGHQTSSNVCTASNGNDGSAPIAGVGVSTSSYTVVTSGTTGGSSMSFMYTLAHADHYTFIIISTELPFTPTSIPSGCSEIEEVNSGGYYEVYIAACTAQAASTYTVTGTMPSTAPYNAWAVYSV